jgi:hypothetical protein
MLHDRVVRRNDDLAIRRVLVHRERRDDADVVADCNAAHARTDRIDHACGFVPEARRKLDRLDIDVGAPHGFGTVDTDCLDVNANFIRPGGADLLLDEFQHFGTAGFCKLNRA